MRNDKYFSNSTVEEMTDTLLDVMNITNKLECSLFKLDSDTARNIHSEIQDVREKAIKMQRLITESDDVPRSIMDQLSTIHFNKVMDKASALVEGRV